MRIRIIENGWETYTGPLCGVQFDNGLSEDTTARQAALVGNIMRVETDDVDKRNPSDSATLITRQCVAMSEKMDMPDRYAPVSGSVATEAKVYTREELEQIAADKGISGLRAIADPIGIKCKSIVTLIDAIMSHGAISAEVRPAESPAKPGVDDEFPVAKDE